MIIDLWDVEGTTYYDSSKPQRDVNTKQTQDDTL